MVAQIVAGKADDMVDFDMTVDCGKDADLERHVVAAGRKSSEDCRFDIRMAAASAADCSRSSCRSAEEILLVDN